MLNALKSLVKQPMAMIGRRYIRMLCENDQASSWRGSFIGGQNERPIEYSFALRALNAAAPTRVLDVGTGRTAWPHLLATCGFAVTAIDQVDEYWHGDAYNRHWHITRDDIRAPKLGTDFNAITCLSVLEHIPDHQQALDTGISEPNGVRNKGWISLSCCQPNQ